MQPRADPVPRAAEPAGQDEAVEMVHPHGGGREAEYRSRGAPFGDQPG